MRLTCVEGTQPDKWVRIWRERHRDVPLEIAFVAERDQWEQLTAGSAELAIVRIASEPEAMRAARERGFAVELYRERELAVLPRDHAFAEEPEVALDDLAELAYTPTQPTTAETLALTAAGVGWTRLEQSVFRVHQRKDLVGIPIVDAPERPVLLVWCEDSPLVQDFVGITRGRGANSHRG